MIPSTLCGWGMWPCADGSHLDHVLPLEWSVSPKPKGPGGFPEGNGEQEKRQWSSHVETHGMPQMAATDSCPGLFSSDVHPGVGSFAWRKAGKHALSQQWSLGLRSWAWIWSKDLVPRIREKSSYKGLKGLTTFCAESFNMEPRFHFRGGPVLELWVEWNPPIRWLYISPRGFENCRARNWQALCSSI